jgi:tetratricopeptide (TPR) repeat protein
MDQVDKANGLNEQVLAQNRRDADALVLKGQIMTRQGKSDPAISILRGVVNDAQTNALAHFALGSALNASGDHNAAKDEWRRAAQLQPDMVQVQRVLAQVALAEHDKSLLKESSERIITSDPQSPDGYVYRALAEADNKQDDKVEADLNKAIQVAPQNSMGYAKMARWRLVHKRYAEAEKLYEQALERDPNNSDALQGLIATYQEERRTDRMLVRVHEQIAKAPNNSSFYFLLGVLQEEGQDLGGAESSAQKAISLDPNNNDAFELLGRVEAKAGALEKALANSYDWIKRNPKYARAYVLTGSLEEARGNWRSAQELYRKAIDLQPHYADAQNNLAFLLLERGGDTNEALSLARDAHTEAPDVATIADTLAWAYYHKGLYKTAIGLLQDALKAEPDSAQYHYHIGLAYEKINDRLQAKLHLHKALAIEPKSAQADLVRKELQELGS